MCIYGSKFHRRHCIRLKIAPSFSNLQILFATLIYIAYCIVANSHTNKIYTI